MDIAPSYRQLHASGQLAERAEKARAALASCHLCPRHCGVNRLEGQKGYCRSGARALVASYSPPFWRGRGTGRPGRLRHHFFQ